MSFFTALTTGTRHMLDANVTFGQASERYNARDKYRREDIPGGYDDDQRMGAGIGTAFGTAVPAIGLAAWAKGGFKSPLAPPGMVASNSAKVFGALALGGATAAGAWKLSQITKDDGNFGAIGATGGIVAGAVGGLLAGRALKAGKYAPLISGAGMIAGGIAGYQGGKRIEAGTGERIKDEHKQAPNVDTTAAGRVGSFVRGTALHFTEVGPASTGISFGYSWGMRDSFEKQYSNAERAGGMHGDLLAAGILGTGALAIVGAAAKGGSNALPEAANAAGHILERAPIHNMLAKLHPMGAAGIGAAAVELAGMVALKEHDRVKDGGGSDRSALIAGGASIAATAGVAALASRAPAFKGMAAAPKAAGTALVAAALIGVLSSVRFPVQQFINDARSAHKVDGQKDLAVTGAATGVGLLAGGYGAFKGLSKLVPDSGISLGKFHLSKGAVVGGGALLGAAELGGAGFGLSATMPDITTVGMSVAGGAALGLAGATFARGMTWQAGLAAGSMLGLSASSLLKQDTPAATPDPAASDAKPAATAPDAAGATEPAAPQGPSAIQQLVGAPR